MKLITLTFHNFMQYRDHVLDTAGGENIVLIGPNGVGKSSVGAGLTWLLFGRNLLGKADDNIKIVGPDGEVIHHLDYSVEGVFLMASGKTLTLKRIYQECWEPIRGSELKELTKHTTKRFINGAPKSEKEYNDYLSGLCNLTMFRGLVDAGFFVNDKLFPWTEMRKMLFTLCGDMTDAQVIEADPELRELGELLVDLTIDEFKEKTKLELKETKDLLPLLPARIDEANRSVPDPEKEDWDSLLVTRNTELGKLQQQRATLLAGGGAAQLRSQLVDIDSKIRCIGSDLANQPNPARETAIEAKRTKTSEVGTATRTRDDIKFDIGSRKRRLAAMEAEIASKNVELVNKRAEVETEAAKVYTASSDCPTCLQPLPASEVEAAKSRFNLAKAEKVEALNKAGLAFREALEKLESEQATMQAEFKAKELSLVAADAEILRLQTELDTIVVPDAVAPDPEKDSRVIAFRKDRIALDTQLTRLNVNLDASVKEVDENITAVQLKIVECHSGQQRIASRKTGLERIKELEAQHKKLAADADRLAHGLYLCEKFVRSKVSMLSTRINSQFQLVEWQLFEIQINGGIKECCIPLWRENGAIPSAGQLMQIAFDIIAMVSDHIGFTPPIVLDNAESVTWLPPMPGQVILLIVSDEVEGLQVRKGGKKVSVIPSAPLTLEERAHAALRGNADIEKPTTSLALF